MADLSDVVYCKIFPGIGIARVGDSPSDFFVGPEAPGVGPERGTQFKDGKGRIKRQAARFRIFGFDQNDKPVLELTPSLPGVLIEWEVELANRKASANIFAGVKAGLQNDQHPDPDQMRNRNVSDRSMLEITPSLRRISGINTGGSQYSFNDGSFMGRAVYLGELRTDPDGRLLVLGGRGLSDHVPGSLPITQYANNDGWHDDTSDGCVRAQVSVNGNPIPIKGDSWVIVAPPKFAPYIRNVVSLYDVISEATKSQNTAGTLSFTNDIYPHFAAFSDQQWVNDRALRGHGPRKRGSFVDPETLAKLNDNSAENAPYRRKIFDRIRNPNQLSDQQANYNYMPQLSGDEGDATVGDPQTWLVLTKGTYGILRRWAEGDFDSDWTGVVPELDGFDVIPIEDQPSALNRASLEWCVGGPFFPGIEITYIARDPSYYVEQFRFDSAKIKPGDLTCRMAVPWQADFYECREHWWPAQRPDDVLVEEIYERTLRDFPAELDAGRLSEVANARLSWDRGVGDHWKVPEIDDSRLADRIRRHAGDNDMVEKWKTLGFVIPIQTDKGEILQVEVGRGRFEGLSDRDYFYLMLNVESYPDFIPRAKQIAERFLSDAEALMFDVREGAVDDMYRFFPYSKDAFDQRMDEIYAFYQAGIDVDPALDLDSPFQTKEDMIERIKQYAPLNQLDGAWVRNVGRAGPIDEVSSLLFSVWMDEVGDGDPDQNHANVYTNLLEQVGIHLPPINTRDYAYHSGLLDSAYTVPLFELAISQFTDTFFPEILGMTLQLEWEVLALWPTVRLLRHFGLDSHFYELHIGIDNAVNGHGAKARQAVDRFVDDARRRGGEAEAQAVWRRIWTGYVAFATTGTLGNDLRDLLISRRNDPQLPESRVKSIIAEKKKYGSLNHNTKSLGCQLINDLFEDSDTFLDSLVQAGYIVPGHPELSKFFQLTGFTGPMYRVFTDEELRIWEQWVFSLGAAPPQPVVTDPGLLMEMLVNNLRSDQEDVSAHQVTNLVGPDPQDATQSVTRSVSDWIQEATPVFLSVLSDPRNNLIVSGHANQSRFVTNVLSSNNAMARRFNNVAPNSGGKTWRDVVVAWIDAGCPIPRPTQRSLSVEKKSRIRLTLTDPVSVVNSHPRGRILGMGCVH